MIRSTGPQRAVVSRSDAPRLTDASAVETVITAAPDHLPSRLLLLAVSLYAIDRVGDGFGLVAFVLGFTAVAYALLRVSLTVLRHRARKPALVRWSVTLNWVSWAAAFCYLQLSGKVGTLTGNQSSLVGQLAVTIGLPFYVLSIAALHAEVLRGRQRLPSPLNYLLYVVYFPKFLSGPIEQPEFVHRLAGYRFTLDPRRLDQAARWIVVGVFYKFIVGRALAKIYFPEVSDQLLTLLVGIVAFELRVYFDLCGYSLMAYGASKALGIDLTLNFGQPFFSGNLRDFWQRWHISLGRWFHRYIYQPLRDSRLSRQLLGFSSVAVFLVSAAWHGLTLNFLLWGLFHGIAFTLYTRIFRHRSYSSVVGVTVFLATLLIGRLLFMEPDFARLCAKLLLLLNPLSWLMIFTDGTAPARYLFEHTSRSGLVAAFGCAGYALFLEWRSTRNAREAYSDHRGSLLLVTVALICLFGASGSEGMIYARQ